MKRRNIARALIVTGALGLIGAGCVQPNVADVGDVTVPSQPAPDQNAQIPPQCRADLTALGQPGVALLMETDARLNSAFTFLHPDVETAGALNDLAVNATNHGVTSCGTPVTTTTQP